MLINLNLIYPMFAMVLLTVTVLIVMFRARVAAVKQGQVDIKYFRNYEGGTSLPDTVIRTQRHFTNLFEVPVLFYAGCLAAMVVPVHGYLILFWAWAYVILRAAHAFIHIKTNRLGSRMKVYGLAWLCLLGLWITIIATVIIIQTTI